MDKTLFLYVFLGGCSQFVQIHHSQNPLFLLSPLKGKYRSSSQNVPLLPHPLVIDTSTVGPISSLEKNKIPIFFLCYPPADTLMFILFFITPEAHASLQAQSEPPPASELNKLFCPCSFPSSWYNPPPGAAQMPVLLFTPQP